MSILNGIKFAYILMPKLFVAKILFFPYQILSFRSQNELYFKFENFNIYFVEVEQVTIFSSHLILILKLLCFDIIMSRVK